ncbi:unnamed protein product [Rotaria socialis]|uniref:Uncharacterized protein n=1 Tax=Rotaria socialis TaxID=392032 RepID=A0A819Z9U5_9BILA|nr:unnamed protein product [Rotaria socialis]CAF3451672.1 unnamed protein product [Rotaria socialis]CAF4170898.1 unnamed protein product [Rotaria socialis]CAF4384318.1 unnamed protein product [Rotaria socialis]
MVKQKSYSHNDGDMNTYKIRKTRAGPVHNHKKDSFKNNHVPVAQSNGCCSSKTPNNSPSTPIIVQSPTVRSSTPQLTSHEKTHLKLDPYDPFYYHYGRINKNINERKHSYQQKNAKNKIHPAIKTAHQRQTNNNSTLPVRSTVPTTKKQSSCCTIL